MLPSRNRRLHIGFFGRRNAGKSTLVNALAGETVSIVSPVAGTTTDPVEKAMELHGIGPATLIDTAGLDDTDTPLGRERVVRSRAALGRCDLAIVVYADEWSPLEQSVFDECARRGIPAVSVHNPHDGGGPSQADLLHLIRSSVPESTRHRPALVSDLVPAGATVVLVTPIDPEAPVGRLILPQVQTLRDLLDGHCLTLVVQDTELAAALAVLRTPPALVVTDSQAFARVSALVPPEIPLTSFSVLMARFQGDFAAFLDGARTLAALRPGDTVAIAEACTHRPDDEDIGTVKIPRFLQKKAGGELHFRFLRGHDLPDDLTDVHLVIHCGACVWNRRAMLQRISECRSRGIPITNYGMTIAWCLGILERAVEPLVQRSKD